MTPVRIKSFLRVLDKQEFGRGKEDCFSWQDKNKNDEYVIANEKEGVRQTGGRGRRVRP